MIAYSKGTKFEGTPEQLELVAAKLGRLGNKKPLLTGLATHGRAALAKADKPGRSLRRHTITVWYESAGGEILRTELVPMTSAQATVVYNRLLASTATRVVHNGPGCHFEQGRYVDAARSVVFPSEQYPQEVEALTES